MSTSSPRFAYVAHCLLNANAKVDEWTPCTGVHFELLRILREKGYVIRRMPCPDLAFMGLNRFWQVWSSTTRRPIGAIAPRWPILSPN